MLRAQSYKEITDTSVLLLLSMSAKRKRDAGKWSDGDTPVKGQKPPETLDTDMGVLCKGSLACRWMVLQLRCVLEPQNHHKFHPHMLPDEKVTLQVTNDLQLCPGALTQWANT